MVGFVIVGHGNVAEALIATAQGIVGPLEQVVAVNLLPHEGLDLGRAKIAEAVRSVNANLRPLVTERA